MRRSPAPPVGVTPVAAPQLAAPQLAAPPAAAGGPAVDVPGEWWLEEPDDPLSDEELVELALRAPLEAPLPDDAVPLRLAACGAAPATLPSWYMPAVALRHSSGRTRVVVLSIVTALLVLEALGLCSVFGQVVIG